MSHDYVINAVEYRLEKIEQQSWKQFWNDPKSDSTIKSILLQERCEISNIIDQSLDSIRTHPRKRIPFLCRIPKKRSTTQFVLPPVTLTTDKTIVNVFDTKKFTANFVKQLLVKKPYYKLFVSKPEKDIIPLFESLFELNVYYNGALLYIGNNQYYFKIPIEKHPSTQHTHAAYRIFVNLKQQRHLLKNTLSSINSNLPSIRTEHVETRVVVEQLKHVLETPSVPSVLELIDTMSEITYSSHDAYHSQGAFLHVLFEIHQSKDLCLTSMHYIDSALDNAGMLLEFGNYSKYVARICDAIGRINSIAPISNHVIQEFKQQVPQDYHPFLRNIRLNNANYPVDNKKKSVAELKKVAVAVLNLILQIMQPQQGGGDLKEILDALLMKSDLKTLAKMSTASKRINENVSTAIKTYRSDADAEFAVSNPFIHLFKSLKSVPFRTRVALHYEDGSFVFSNNPANGIFEVTVIVPQMVLVQIPIAAYMFALKDAKVEFVISLGNEAQNSWMLIEVNEKLVSLNVIISRIKKVNKNIAWTEESYNDAIKDLDKGVPDFKDIDLLMGSINKGYMSLVGRFNFDMKGITGFQRTLQEISRPTTIPAVTYGIVKKGSGFDDALVQVQFTKTESGAFQTKVQVANNQAIDWEKECIYPAMKRFLKDDRDFVASCAFYQMFNKCKVVVTMYEESWTMAIETYLAFKPMFDDPLHYDKRSLQRFDYPIDAPVFTTALDGDFLATRYQDVEGVLRACIADGMFRKKGTMMKARD